MHIFDIYYMLRKGNWFLLEIDLCGSIKIYTGSAESLTMIINICAKTITIMHIIVP